MSRSEVDVQDTAAAERSVWSMSLEELQAREQQLLNASMEIRWALNQYVSGSPDGIALLNQLTIVQGDLLTTARAAGAAAADRGGR